jgi:hypothetical protein
MLAEGILLTIERGIAVGEATIVFEPYAVTAQRDFVEECQRARAR